MSPRSTSEQSPSDFLHTSDYLSQMDRLKTVLKPLGRLAIACSGGVDSTVLAVAAAKILGPDNVLLLTANAPMVPQSDRLDALGLEALTGSRHQFVELSDQILDQEPFKSNPPDRCYHCKKIIFNRLLAATKQAGFKTLCDGTNQDDLGDYRPGLQALRELGIFSPLVHAGLSKADIRQLAMALCPDYSAKPAMACLATRIPTHTPVTLAAMQRIDRAETALRSHGFMQVRVRDHAGLARVEVDASWLRQGMSGEQIKLLSEILLQAGFTYVTLDLQGYRSGSMNPEANT